MKKREEEEREDKGLQTRKKKQLKIKKYDNYYYRRFD